MRVLALDTSHATGSIAFVVAGDTPWTCELLASATARVSNAHGESLLPLVEMTLKNAHATMPLNLVTVEREIDFFNAVTFGAVSEPRFRPGRTTTEQNAVGWFHRQG